MWPAAQLLADHLAAKPHIILGCPCALELGSGLGFPGLIAAQARHVMHFVAALLVYLLLLLLCCSVCSYRKGAREPSVPSARREHATLLMPFLLQAH